MMTNTLKKLKQLILFIEKLKQTNTQKYTYKVQKYTVIITGKINIYINKKKKRNNKYHLVFIGGRKRYKYIANKDTYINAFKPNLHCINYSYITILVALKYL